MEQETVYLLALTLTPGIGVHRLLELLDRSGSAESIVRAPESTLKRYRMGTELQSYLASGLAVVEAERMIEKALGDGIQILDYRDGQYPKMLRKICDPPLILFVKGNLQILNTPCVAIVGSRRCSVYGSEVTLRLARELSGHGLTVVSGMARGIDSKAHWGALQGSGNTIAVLGTGVDVIYPRENRKLYGRICEAGCAVSEFPLGCHPAPQNFPIRNRIISGLSYGTLIPEAAEFSGSQITARMTLEQGREVWAVPGNITSPGSYGPNYLIKQGAAPVMSCQDVIDELPLPLLRSLRTFEPPATEKPEELSPAEESVLGLLQEDRAIHIDRLLRESGLSLTELNASLVQLEIKGRVRQYPGRRFAKRM